MSSALIWTASLGPDTSSGRAESNPLLADDCRTQPWRRAVLAAELCPLRPHDLKHTGVALLALAGVDPSEISRRAGHSWVAFTYDRYGHLFPEVDKQAAQKLERVRGLVSTESVDTGSRRRGSRADARTIS
jgi:integrase